MESKLMKWITRGGILAALVSTLCCIGPLVLGLVGIGGASSLLFLEEYRAILIWFVVLLIGVGWFMNFLLEQKECAKDSICADPKKRKNRRIGLGISTLISAILIMSPILLDSVSQAQNISGTNSGKTKTLYVEGMTCGGCEIGVREALRRAGLSDKEILSVDHSNPFPDKKIGSAIIKINKEAECKIIKEIKTSPGYIAYWSFEDKDPCHLNTPKSTAAKVIDSNLDIVKRVLSSTYDSKQNKICQRGCAEKSMNYTDADVKPNANAVIGKVTKCPVSGVMFRVKKSTPKIEHNGKNYQFCCNSCALKFKAKFQKT